VVLRRKLMALLMTVMLLVMSAALALADPVGGFGNEGHKGDDGADHNKGGGQEKPKNANQKNGQL
jgi:hypothetical protein